MIQTPIHPPILYVELSDSVCVCVCVCVRGEIISHQVSHPVHGEGVAEGCVVSVVSLDERHVGLPDNLSLQLLLERTATEKYHLFLKLHNIVSYP